MEIFLLLIPIILMVALLVLYALKKRTQLEKKIHEENITAIEQMKKPKMLSQLQQLPIFEINALLQKVNLKFKKKNYYIIAI